MADIKYLQSQLESKKRDKESYQRDYDRAAEKLKRNPSDSSATNDLERIKDHLEGAEKAIEGLESQIRSSV